MSTHVVNEFHALPDRADDVISLLIELSPVNRTRPGCQAISLARTISPGVPSPATRRSWKKMLAQPMSIRYFDEVRAW